MRNEIAEAEDVKITPGFALEAVIQQLRQWKADGADAIVFETLSTHPESDDDCTFGDLIEPASEQMALIAECIDLIAAAPDLLKALRKCPALAFKDTDLERLVERYGTTRNRQSGGQMNRYRRDYERIKFFWLLSALVGVVFVFAFLHFVL